MDPGRASFDKLKNCSLGVVVSLAWEGSMCPAAVEVWLPFAEVLLCDEHPILLQGSLEDVA